MIFKQRNLNAVVSGSCAYVQFLFFQHSIEEFADADVESYLGLFVKFTSRNSLFEISFYIEEIYQFFSGQKTQEK